MNKLITWGYASMMKEWPTSCELTKGNFDIMISALMQGSARSLPCTGVCNGLHFYMCINEYDFRVGARVCVWICALNTHTRTRTHRNARTNTLAHTHTHRDRVRETETDKDRKKEILNLLICNTCLLYRFANRRINIYFVNWNQNRLVHFSNSIRRRRS